MRKLFSVLMAASMVLALHAAVHEDDWVKVETPDKVTPGAGFQVKVTLKKDLGPKENVTVAMHRFKTDGGWLDTGEWRPPQTMKKGETKSYSFKAKFADNIGHFGPIVFIAPNGDWGKAKHKLFCDKIRWAMSSAEAAKKKTEAEAAAARTKPPAGITYKKSWIVPRGCFKPGTDEPAREIREGEPFDVVADYYLDPSEYWNNKCHIVVFGCGLRHVVCAERGRHSWFHLRPDHIDIICIDFHIPGFDINDAPVLPAVPVIDPLIIADAHRPVEEQCPADEVHPVEFDRADQVKVEDVRGGQSLLLQLRQRVLEGVAPELVIAQRDDHRQVGRNEHP